MTVLPDLNVIVDQAILTLADGQTTVLRTPADARALGDKCRAAEQLLVEREREHAEQRDREAAAAMANADLTAHTAWGSTLAGWPAKPAEPLLLIRACGCSKTEKCPDCTEKSA